MPIAAAIAQSHGLPELLGRVLAARGADVHSLAPFLDPSIRTLLPDPSSLQDMEEAAARFARAIAADEQLRYSAITTWTAPPRWP